MASGMIGLRAGSNGGIWGKKGPAIAGPGKFLWMPVLFGTGR